MKRCVVTGIGIISPLGSSKEIFWENLLAGKTGVGEIEGFDASTFPAAIAAEVKDFDEAEHLSGHQSKYFGKASKFAYAAAKMALADLPLKTILNEPVVPYEACDVTRLILDSHDDAAFAPIASVTVGELREHLLSERVTSETLARLAPGMDVAAALGE